jgi:putative transposase
MSGRWLNLKEVIDATGWGVRTVQRKVRNGELKTATKDGRRKYFFDSLPFHVRLRLEQKNASAKETELPVSGKEQQPPAVQNVATAAPFALLPPAEPEALARETQPAKSSPPKVALSEKEEEAARARLAIIEPLINFQAENHAAPRSQLHLDLGLRLPDGREVSSLTTMAEYLSRSHDLSRATIFRWYRDFRRAGLIGLAPKTRNDKNKSRFFERYPKAATLASYLFLEQRQSVEKAHEAIKRDRLSLGIAPAARLPSYETVRRLLKGLPEPLKLLAREGQRVYRERCAPYLSRTRINVSAGELWVGDHMTHDFFAKNDSFLDAEFGARIRLRFTAFADWRSNYFTGYSWCWEGSSNSITSALRRGVQRYGPPEWVYIDNGKDYMKVAKGAMPAYLRSEIEPADWWKMEYSAMTEVGLFGRMGIAVQHCIVRRPQSKHVERLFGTVHSGFDRMFPTYTGPSPDKRPDFAAKAIAEHSKLLRLGSPGHSKLPWTSEVIRMGITWIEEVYHNKVQKSKDMEGMSPRQAFEAFRNPNQRPAPEPEVLALCLAEHKSCKVTECQFVLNTHAYIGDDEPSAIMLHQQNGRRLTVAFDPLDLAKVAVLDDNNRLIAWAKQKNFVTQSAESGPAISESMRLRRRLEKQTVGQIIALGTEARANGAISEAEHLAARAGVLNVEDLVTQRQVRVRPDNKRTAPVSAAEGARGALAILRGEDSDDAVTQRRARLRPDNTATAPISAAEGARQVLAMLREEDADDAVTQRRAGLRPDNTAAAPMSAAEVARGALAILREG